MSHNRLRPRRVPTTTGEFTGLAKGSWGSESMIILVVVISSSSSGCSALGRAVTRAGLWRFLVINHSPYKNISKVRMAPEIGVSIFHWLSSSWMIGTERKVAFVSASCRCPPTTKLSTVDSRSEISLLSRDAEGSTGRRPTAQRAIPHSCSPGASLAVFSQSI